MLDDDKVSRLDDTLKGFKENTVKIDVILHYINELHLRILTAESIITFKRSVKNFRFQIYLSMKKIF